MSAVSTPRADGLAMPAEWAPHERCIMGWPVREALWGAHMAQAQRSYAEVANAVAAFEPVLMVAPAGEAARAARAACGAGVEIVELPLDDSWLRDSGPIFVLSDDGERTAVDFHFNGWGERFTPYAEDDLVTRRLCEHLGERRYDAGLVLEGGSIAVDGEGTLITTEQCLLHPRRNPRLSREEIQTALYDWLGVEKVIWLGQGLVEDRDTDGHVDNLCAFAAPGVVVVQGTDDPDSPNRAEIEENRRRLEEATDARGRALEVVEIDALPYARDADEPTVVPYVNFYVANGGVVVPVAGADPEQDERALALIRAAYPEREVVGVPGETLACGGGGVHCITQQMPAAAG